jgi:hypothetical protein
VKVITLYGTMTISLILQVKQDVHHGPRVVYDHDLRAKLYTRLVWCNDGSLLCLLHYRIQTHLPVGTKYHSWSTLISPRGEDLAEHRLIIHHHCV